MAVPVRLLVTLTMVISYTIPVFNLTFDWWNSGNSPSSGPPDIVGVPCQLYNNSRIHYAENQELRFPVNLALVFDVPYNSYIRPVVEVVPGSGTYLAVYTVKWVHRGFGNEYWAAVCIPCDNAGSVIVSHVP